MATMQHNAVALDAAAAAIRRADALVIGASNGLSIAEGFNIFAGDEWFRANFGDFQRRFGFKSVLEGCFFAFPTEGEKWAYWSRLATLATYGKAPTDTMLALAAMTEGKDRFVLTTNGEGHFQPVGFDEGEVFEAEGTFTKSRCLRRCTDEAFPNKEDMLTMAKAERDCMVPASLMPRCPRCGGSMEVDMADSQAFFQTPAWRDKQRAFQEFAARNHGRSIVFLELGVGWRNELVKQPMHQLALQEPDGAYIVFNRGEAILPRRYQGEGIVLEGDITSTIAELGERL